MCVLTLDSHMARIISTRFPVKVIHMINDEYLESTLTPRSFPSSSVPRELGVCAYVCVSPSLLACVHLQFILLVPGATSWKAGLTNLATQTVTTTIHLKNDLRLHKDITLRNTHTHTHTHTQVNGHLAPTLMII